MRTDREFRLYKRDEIWWFDLRLPGGKRIRDTTRCRDRLAAISEARKRIEEILTAAPEGATLARLGAEMIAAKEKGGARPGYTRQLIQHFRDYVLPFYGADRNVGTLTDSVEHELFKTKLDSDVRSSKTVNRILVTMRQALKFAKSKGQISFQPDFPLNHPENPAEDVDRWLILPPEEVGHVVGLVTEHYRYFFVFKANTGARLDEVLSLRGRDCDLERESVRIRAVKAKSRKSRVIDLNAPALRALRIGLAKNAERPFPFDPHRLWDAWDAARRAYGVDSMRIHDLRHSRISNLLDEGVPVHVVRDIAGHSSIAVTDLYAHSSDEARRQAAKKAAVDVDLVAPVGTRGTVRGTIRCSGTESNRRHEDFQSPLPSPESLDRSSG